MAFLLTWHGTLLCRHRASGALVHRPLPDVPADADPIVLDLPMEQLQPVFVHHLRAEVPVLPDTTPGDLHQFRLQRGNDPRTVAFQQQGAFLSAEPGGDATGVFRTEHGDWQSFLPVSQADLEALRLILTSSWLIGSTGAMSEPATLGPFYTLRFGDVVFDLRHQLPFDLVNWPYRLTLLRDGWRIERIFRYRPLVYYSAFGSPEIMQQLAISLRSLLQHGRYDRAIVVLTDHSPQRLADFLPAEDRGRIAIIQFAPHDRPGFMAARYLLLDWPDALQFQPVLYVDTDIVFDNDVAPMLRAIAMSDRIAVPIELMSTLAGNVSTGASLIERDMQSPGFLAGFNSGTLGIPNLRAHAETLRLIRTLIMNHATLHGRHALPYVDQEIANYLAYRLGQFDKGLISRFVRYAGHDAHLGARCGLVHFWPVPGAGERVKAMQEYAALLA